MIVGFWYRFWGLSFMTVDQKAQVANAREEQQMSNENDEQNRAEVAPTSPTADDYVRATALAVGVDPDEAVAYRRATDRTAGERSTAPHDQHQKWADPQGLIVETQPAGEHHTGTLDLTGEGNAPGSPISDDAVGAFSEAYLLEILSRVSTASLPSNSAVRAGLTAALPAIRHQVAEEIAVAIERSEDRARLAETTEGIAGNKTYAATWSDIATGYMRAAELAREIGRLQ